MSIKFIETTLVRVLAGAGIALFLAVGAVCLAIVVPMRILLGAFEPEKPPQDTPKIPLGKTR